MDWFKVLVAMVVAFALATASACEGSALRTVSASDVEIRGELTGAERELVDWALQQFARRDLELPPVIDVVFDPTGAACLGSRGRCDPPNGHSVVTVCEAPGSTMHRIVEQRITLLHELAHLWHWCQGDGESWPDASEIVGGHRSRADSPWIDRPEERVAIAISWGLLDQKRRPVGSPFECVELYEQFVALTGSVPLGPLEPVCLPSAVAEVSMAQ